MKILLIDDNETVLSAMKRLLKDFEVTAVTSGSAALDALKEYGDFDKVICDIDMPEMNGLEVFDKIRLQYPKLASRFIFCSAALTGVTMERVLENNCAFMKKPFDPTAFLELVSQ